MASPLVRRERRGAVAGCPRSPAAAAPHTYTIVIDKMKFGPVPANLHKGDTIVWANRDIIQHSATAADHSFDLDLTAGRRGRSCSQKPVRYRSSAATIRACAAFSSSNELKAWRRRHRLRLIIGRMGDAEIARLCAARDRHAIEHVVTANNQRLFRTAWSILKHRAEAEEAVQAAYLSAFANIGAFEGRSSLSTWLTRIVVNEALGRRRSEERRRRQLEQEGVAVLDAYREALMRGSEADAPDVTVAREQIRKLLEQAVGELPDNFRTVFVLREIEGLSSEETAAILDVPVATVKTRLFRGRQRLQQKLAPERRATLSGTFPFAGADCAAMTAAGHARARLLTSCRSSHPSASKGAPSSCSRIIRSRDHHLRPLP